MITEFHIEFSFRILIFIFILFLQTYTKYFDNWLSIIIIGLAFIQMDYESYYISFLMVFGGFTLQNILKLKTNPLNLYPMAFCHIHFIYILLILNLIAIKFNLITVLRIYYIIYILGALFTIFIHTEFKRSGII